MKDQNKTREQLIDEVVRLRQQLNAFTGPEGAGKQQNTARPDSPDSPASISFTEEIAKRRQDENSLYESEEKLRMILEYSPHCIVLTDLSGAIIDCSQSSLDVAGLTKEEILGKSAYGLIAPRDRRMASENMKKIIKQDAMRAYEFTLVNKEGREYEFELTGGLIKDRHGNPVAVITVSKDITEHRRAEQELALRALLLDSANDAIVLHDFDGNLYYANEVVCSFFGYTKEEMMQINIFNLPIGESPGYKRSKIEELKKQGYCIFEATASRNGAWLSAEVKSRVIRTGNRQMILSAARDITRRKQAEQALERERDFSNAVLDTAGTLVAVVDPAGHIIRFNHACESASGYSFQEVQGKIFWDFLLPSEEAVKIRKAYLQLCASNFPSSGENHWITKQGDHRLIAWRQTVLLNEASAIEYVIATGQDITKKRQLGIALQQSEERFRALFENAPMGIVMCRHDGKILLANQTCLSMFGRTNSELYDRNCTEYIVPHLRKNILEMIARHADGEVVPRLFETIGLKRDGSSFPIFMEISSIDLSGVTLVVLFISDISGVKQTEEKLRLSHARLEITLEQTVKSLSHMAGLRDPYTAEHQNRVANLACAIAADLEMPAALINVIRTSALIHDIGKTAIPSEVLSKPGELNDIERAFVKVHVQAGYDIVKAIEFQSPIAEIILQHHERLNGSGYPQGLSGENILKEAKIIAVADVVEAMASHRPYRPAMPIDEALNEIRQNRGVLYDPEAVDVCLKIFAEKRFNLNN